MSSARNVAVIDTIAALLAAFVIIPSMAAGGAELSSGGPGLMFIYLVNVFNGMPGGKIVGIVFYVCVLFAGMSSLVIQGIVSGWMDAVSIYICPLGAMLAANMFLFHFHLLHLSQVLYLVELADDWHGNNGIGLADCFAIRLFCVVGSGSMADWTLEWWEASK